MLGLFSLSSQAQVRFVQVDPTANEFTLQNFGNEAVDVSDYRLCSKFNYSPGPLSALTVLEGSLMLEAGASVELMGFGVDEAGADLGLYLASGSFGDPNSMVDFLQWGSSGNGRESVAASKGIWTAGEFIDVAPPFVYTGDGTEDGVSTWSTQTTMDEVESDFVAKLTGSQEVQPVMTMAHGMVYADLIEDTLKVWGSFEGLQGDFNIDVAGGSHLHLGYAGQNGDFIITLVPTLDADSRGGTYEIENNQFILEEAEVQALQNRQLYVNIHTTAYPSGEIRGQMLPNGDASYMVNLFGSNEVPSIMSEASGALMLDVTDDQLVVTGSFMGLEGMFDPNIANTGIHLHMGKAGENAGVSIFLNADATDGFAGVLDASTNTFTLTPEQMELLEGRNLYANVHSMAFPSGELRGQVGEIARARFRVHLSGANEVIPVLTEATGELFVELLDSTLTVSGTFQNLESELATDIEGGAHIHLGYAGENGGILRILNVASDDNLSGSFEVSENTYEVDSALMAALFARQLYVNIHSQNNRGGELRGQILPEGMFVLNGFLSGTNEVTPALTLAHGAIKAEISGDKLTFSGSFDDLASDLNTDIEGGGHLHLALAGSNGPLRIPLNITIKDGNRGGYIEAMNNRFDLGEGLLDSLRMRYGYINIHSMDIPTGEIRGQLLHEATAYFTAPLAASSEVPAVNSGASGAVVAEYTNGMLYISGSFNDLESEVATDILGGAHIHAGLPGMNGPIVFETPPTLADGNQSGSFFTDDYILELSEGKVDSLRKRMYYVNIHSQVQTGGELRGNLLPLAYAYFTTSLDGKNEVDPVSSPGVGALKLELSGDQLTVTGAFSELGGEYNAEIQGGSHLHAASVGANGGIAVELMPSVATDLKSGMYLADSNTYTLDAGQLADLLAGNMYFNLHSTTIPSGELRGQILPESNLYPRNLPVISSPMSGAEVEIAGDPATPFEATWSASTEPDGNALAYIWQLAADPGFNTVLVNTNVGTETSFTTDFGTVNTLLQAAGLPFGDSIVLYHRAIATDGAVCLEGQVDSVELTRGTITNLAQELEDEFTLSIFPSPVEGMSTLSMYAPQAVEGRIRVMDLIGRELLSRKVFVPQGDHDFSLDFTTYEPGVYVVQFMADKAPLQTIKVVKRH